MATLKNRPECRSGLPGGLARHSSPQMLPALLATPLRAPQVAQMGVLLTPPGHERTLEAWGESGGGGACGWGAASPGILKKLLLLRQPPVSQGQGLEGGGL